MTWGFSAQRRADRFDAMVDGDATVESHDADLLELVGAMRALPPVTARPEFVADLRERLMAEADTALVPADVSKLKLPDRKPTRERRLAAVVGGIAIVGATTSLAVASQSALPGDSLYPIKRAIESVHTGISVGEANRGSTVLASASSRLDEVDELTRQSDTDAADEARIARTLDAFTEQSIQASDLLLSDYADNGNASSISQLRDFASSSLDQLAALEPLVPPEARDELIRAAGVLTNIDAEAAQQCPTCGGQPIESIPPVLQPVAAPALPLPPAPSPTTQRSEDGGKHHGKGHGKGDDPNLPDVDGHEIPPGSVNPGGTLLPGPQTVDGSSNPLQDLVNGLTGGGSGSGGGGGTPSEGPRVPIVSDALDGVGQILEGVVDPLTGQVQPKQGD